MTSNLFVTANVEQLRTGGSFRNLLPFYQTSWGVGVLNSAIFNSFHNRVEFCTILVGLRNFGGGEGLNTPNLPPPRYATAHTHTHTHTHTHLKLKILTQRYRNNRSCLYFPQIRLLSVFVTVR